MPGNVAGLGQYIPAPFLNTNRSAALRVLTLPQQPAQTDPLLVKVQALVAAGVASAGKGSLKEMGVTRLAKPQAWQGGNLIAQALPVRTALTTVAGAKLAAPVNPTPIVNVNDFAVLGDEIVFDGDLAAIINVAGVVVFAANKITVKPGARISWSPVGFNAATFDQPGNGANGAPGIAGKGSTWSNTPHVASKKGGKGGDGHPGAHGFDGANAPSIVLVGLSIDRLPVIELEGHRGGTGGKGGNGGPGGPGDKGEPAHCNFLGIRDRGRGYGGDGGPGGNAGQGGHGGKGGAGGSVSVYCPRPVIDAFLNVPLDVRLHPGPGGEGGSAGAPGPGGPGGPQGNNCGPGDDTNGRNGSAGPYGASDATPPAQLKGPDGDLHGTLQFNPKTVADIEQLLRDPEILNVVPATASPETAIALQCVNLPNATPQVRLTLGTDRRLITPARAGTTLTFTLPGDLKGGDYQVAIVDATGAALGAAMPILAVVPALDKITGAGRWGSTLTLAGRGFSPGARVQIGAQTYVPQYGGTRLLHVTLPMPGGPFEQQAETRQVRVVDAQGRASGELPLPFEHWLHLGFQPVANQFKFQNSTGDLKAAKVEIDPELFKETFGQDDFSVLKPTDLGSILGDAANPLRVGAGWSYFAAYKAFLEARPGICCAMSAYALDAFFSKVAPPLHDAFGALQGPIARRLFALQGRVMSREQLAAGVACMAQGEATNDRFIADLVAAMRKLVAAQDPNARREYPLLSFLPKATADIAALAKALPKGHVVIPYAVRFPGPGEAFLCRVYCCNNYQRNVVRVEFRKQGAHTTFAAAMVADGVDLAGFADAAHDAAAPYGAWPGEDYSSAANWLAMPLPMRIAIYDDVDIPLEEVQAVIGAFVALGMLV